MVVILGRQESVRKPRSLLARWALLFMLIAMVNQAGGLELRTVPTATGDGLAQATVENAFYRVTMHFDEGGKISEFFDKRSGVNGVAWKQAAGSGFLDDRHVFSGMEYRTGRIQQQPGRIVIPCSVRADDGIELRKTYMFEDDKPFFRVGYEVLNHGYKPYRLWIKNVGVPGGSERTEDEVAVTFFSNGERQTFNPWPHDYYRDIDGGWMALLRHSKRAGYFVVTEPTYLEQFYFWSDSKVSPTFEWIYKPVEPGHSFRTTVTLGILSEVEDVEWIDPDGELTAPPAVLPVAARPEYAKVADWQSLDELYQPSAEEKERGFIPTVLSVETPRRRLTAITADVGRNEGELIPVEIFALKELKDVRLELLGAAAGDPYLRFEAEKDFKLLPEGGKTDIPVGSYGRFWLRVLPVETERIIRGNLAVVSDAGSVELPLQVTVWPVDLPIEYMLPCDPMIGLAGMGMIDFLEGRDTAKLPALLDAMQALGATPCPDPFTANRTLHFKFTREKQTGLPIYEFLAKHGPVTLDTLPELDFSALTPAYELLQERGMTRLILQTGMKGDIAGWQQWSNFGKTALGRELADEEEGWTIQMWAGSQYREFFRSCGFDDLWVKISDEIRAEHIPAWLQAARRWRAIGFKTFTTNSIGIPRSVELLSKMNEQSDGWMVSTVFLRDFLDRTRRGSEVKKMRSVLAPPQWVSYRNGGAVDTWVPARGFRPFPDDVDPVQVEDFAVIADGKPLDVRQGNSPYGNQKQGVAFRIGNSVYVSLPGGISLEGVKFEIEYNIRSATAAGKPPVELQHKHSQWYYGGGYFNHSYLSQRKQTWLGSYFGLAGRGHYVVYSWRPTHFLIWYDKDEGVIFSPAYEGLRDSAEDSAYYRRLVALGASAEILESVVGFTPAAALPLTEKRSDAYAFDDVDERVTFDDYTLAKRRMLKALADISKNKPVGK